MYMYIHTHTCLFIQRMFVRCAHDTLIRVNLRIYLQWRDVAQELVNVRYAEEEHLRIEEEALAARLRQAHEAELARVRAIHFEQEREAAERMSIFEESERRRKAAEEVVRRAEQARQQALALARETCAITLQAIFRYMPWQRLHRARCSGVKRLQARVRRSGKFEQPSVLVEARRVEDATREKEVEWAEIVGFQMADTIEMCVCADACAQMKSKVAKVEFLDSRLPTSRIGWVSPWQVLDELKKICRVEVGLCLTHGSHCMYVCICISISICIMHIYIYMHICIHIYIYTYIYI